MKVAVIQGGPSAEAEVSRRSAAGVAKALQQSGHAVTLMELKPDVARSLVDGSYEVVFPVLQGKLGEDGAVQGLLEVIGIPYVGSGVLACALASDKVQAKHAFRAHGLPVAEQFVVRADDDLSKSIRLLQACFPHGIAVKPCTQGSAIGVSLIDNTQDEPALRRGIEEALRFDSAALCERLLKGREVTCAVLDSGPLGEFRACPVTEIFSKAASWYDFTSRYAKGGSEHACPANLPAEVATRVQMNACAAHRALGCRDLSRVDFVVGDGDDLDTVTLLEVNVIPGMTSTSLYPEAASAAGLSFPDLCDGLVRGASERQSVGPIQAVPVPD